MIMNKKFHVRTIIRRENIYCLLGFLLLCLTLVFSGCEKQNNNAIKVIDPTGSKTEPLVKENDSAIQADDPTGGNNESVISGEQSKKENKRSGVLLGLKSKTKNDNESHYSAGTGFMATINNPQYKTLYITNNNGNVKLSAQGTGILVPRNKEFWLLNIETEKLKGKYKDFDYESNIEYISARRADGKPVGKFDKYNPNELARKWCGYYYPGDPKETSNEVLLELTFVGNDFLTQRVVADGYIGGFQPHIRHWLITIPFHETNKIDVCRDVIMEIEGRAANSEVNGVSISELLGNDAESQFMKEGNEYLEKEELTNEYYIPGEGCWGLFRQNGKWVVKGYLKHGFGTGRYLYGIFDTKINPPKQIVSHDELFPNWQVIQKFLPNAKDAFTSPEKDMLIVLTPEELRVYTDFKDDLIGEVKYIIDLGDIFTAKDEDGEETEKDVIMVQWATGNYVEKWVNEAKKHLNDD